VRLVCGITNGFEPCVQSWKLKVNSNGDWGYNPHWDVYGSDFMSVIWTSPSGDKVRRHNYAPYVVVTIERAFVSGAARDWLESNLMIQNATTGGIRGVAEFSGDHFVSEFEALITKEEGERVRPHVGNNVISNIATDAAFTIENIHANPNADNGRVTGQCPTPTGRFVRAQGFHNGQPIDSGAYTWPEEDGAFEIEFLPFASGDKVLVTCDLPTGDRIQKFFAVP
jgi:hypothetical protein